jgi:hypothetical protein
LYASVRCNPRMKWRVPVSIGSRVLATGLVAAQPVFTGTDIFPREEFAARRARIASQMAWDTRSAWRSTTFAWWVRHSSPDLFHDRARDADRGRTSRIRLEDMILMTDTWYENLSAFVPVEIDASNG